MSVFCPVIQSLISVPFQTQTKTYHYFTHMCTHLNLHTHHTENLMQRGKLTLAVNLALDGNGVFLHILLLAGLV